MTKNAANLLHASVVFLIGLLIIASMCVTAPKFAFADENTLNFLNMTAYELQTEIEERQAAYADSRAKVDEATAKLDEINKRIEELEGKIPEQQQRCARAAREQYKIQQQSASIVDLLLSADNFYEFLSYVGYMDRISSANVDEMMRLSQLKKQIEGERKSVKTAQRDAEAKAEEARVAMEAAQEAQAEVQRRIEEEIRAQAEIAAMAAELAEQPRHNDTSKPGDASGASDSDKSGKSSNSDKSGKSSGDKTETPAPSAESDDDVEEAPAASASSGDWAARIDAYLTGSPLAGQGATFAAAAAAYGVDPRLSPAISFTESSKGRYCFKPYNAWGWGSSSWSSWEEAIYAHVGGLSRGYGGQLTKEGAKRYCPPNWKTWYSRTLSQMNLI